MQRLPSVIVTARRTGECQFKNLSFQQPNDLGVRRRVIEISAYDPESLNLRRTTPTLEISARNAESWKFTRMPGPEPRPESSASTELWLLDRCLGQRVWYRTAVVSRRF